MLYKTKWEDKGLYRKFTKIVSGEEVLGSNLAIQGDERFDKIKYVLNDFTETDEFDVSEIVLNKIVAIDNAAALSNPNLRIAIVATLESLLAWIRLYGEKMQDSSFECQIFVNLDDAYKWVTNS